MLERAAAIARFMTLIGIIDQLHTTRASALLRATGLPYPRFRLLHHFSHHPELGWSISDLARVMEMNQPAVTKLVQRLEAQAFLEARGDAADRRIKRLFITSAGLEAVRQAMQRLAPDLRKAFAALNDAEIAQALPALEAVKAWLDDHRVT